MAPSIPCMSAGFFLHSNIAGEACRIDSSNRYYWRKIIQGRDGMLVAHYPARYPDSCEETAFEPADSGSRAGAAGKPATGRLNMQYQPPSGEPPTRREGGMLETRGDNAFCFGLLYAGRPRSAALTPEWRASAKAGGLGSPLIIPARRRSCKGRPRKSSLRLEAGFRRKGGQVAGRSLSTGCWSYRITNGE